MFFLTLTSVVDDEQSILAFTGVVTRDISADTELSGTAVQVWIQTFIDVYKKMKGISISPSICAFTFASSLLNV